MNELHTRMQHIPGLRWDSGNNLHCDSTKSLRAALKHLRSINYEVQDLRKDGYSRRHDNMSAKQMANEGRSLYYASLKTRVGKCGSCNRYISTRGIRMHGRTCEHCGAVVFRDITDGTQVAFNFLSDGQGWFVQKVRLVAKRWDADEGWLYLYPKPVRHASNSGVMSPKEATRYLQQHRDKWQHITEDGQQLIKVHHPRKQLTYTQDGSHVICMRDVYGNEYNSTIVVLWNGKEYPEHYYGSDNRLPVPESVNIYADYLKK